MRIPSLKAFLIFAAGFAGCLASIVIFLFCAYHFWVKPMQARMYKRMYSTPPRFFNPHPAEFNFTAVGRGVEPLDLNKYRGRVVILNIWATWCQPGELSSFAKLAAHYSDDEDVAVFCFSQESTNRVFKNTGAMNSGAPLYCMGSRGLPMVYRTNGIPATFVIDKKGMIVVEQSGYADWAHPSVIKFIDSLRKNSSSQAGEQSP